MVSATFLEKLYLGTLDESTLGSLEAVQDLDRVERIVDGFREILRDYPPEDVEMKERLPEGMLKRMGEAGLFGLSIPAEYGGLGLNVWEYMRVVERIVGLDISAAMAFIAHLSIGSKAIALFGSEEQKRKYLTPAASGETIFSYALTEPRVGSDAQHIETLAELAPDGSHYILNGHKTYITNANYAGAFTVFAQLDPKRPGFMGAFIVEAGWEGVKVGKDMPKMGLKASSTASIQFRNVRVPVGNLIGRPGDGFKIAMTVLNYGRLGLGAASVGMLDRSIEDMMKRSSSRIQFDVPINSFPLIQEKIVKAQVHSFASTAMNDFAAGILNVDPLGSTAMETSHCKLFGTTRAWDTLYEALQVAGGAGYLATQPYEKRMRDFRVATVFEGTTEIHSIYPPIFMARKIIRQNKVLRNKGISELFQALGTAFQRTEWPVRFSNRLMNKASKVARANAGSVRRLLFLGLILHGTKLMGKEFLLRRITTLSLYSFALLAMLAKIEADRRAGRPVEERLTLLGYFIEEAIEGRIANNRLFDSRRETQIGKVFEGMLQSANGDPRSDERASQSSEAVYPATAST